MSKLYIANMPELPYAMEEAINRLRVNINFLGDEIKKIMVISTMPNEGKSFVTIQLWYQMIKAGTSAILVDADLRKSISVEKYGMSADEGEMKGVSDFLAGNGKIEDAIYSTNIEGGDILPNVNNVVNPSILLENGRFEEMLQYMAGHYRYVFVDSPPLNLVSDGERIGSLCDGAILVIRGGVTSKNMVRNSIRQLERAGCPLLGTVLNRVSGAKAGYYYKRYGGRYYGSKYYGGEDEYYYSAKKKVVKH